MLDKGQIGNWDGAPEQPPPKPKTELILSAVFDSREAIPTGETVRLTPEQAHARKRRGQWMALALLAFVVILFTLTMTKMGQGILVRDL